MSESFNNMMRFSVSNEISCTVTEPLILRVKDKQPKATLIAWLCFRVSERCQPSRFKHSLQSDSLHGAVPHAELSLVQAHASVSVHNESLLEYVVSMLESSASVNIYHSVPMTLAAALLSNERCNAC